MPRSGTTPSISADDVADSASALALLAGGLARLGRELELAHELRRAAERLPPQEAADVRRGVDRHVRRAQAEWRAAMSRYEQQAPSDPTL
ncbi:hypothetical protein [Nocardioides sp.]|uniref:hypothetical protein n=1 Tax=Nocardioides sp. TaxID=35761 RepID=UPI002ED4C9F7